MKTEDVESAIRKYIVNEIMFSKDESALSYDDSLLEKGILDSAALLELITFLEGEFRISVGRTDMVPENFETVRSIAQFVNSQ